MSKRNHHQWKIFYVQRTPYAYCTVVGCSEELNFEDAIDLLGKYQDRIEELEDTLAEIAKAEGPFSMDRLTHAENTILAMVDLAKAVID